MTDRLSTPTTRRVLLKETAARVRCD
jgi:hypothetical protein